MDKAMFLPSAICVKGEDVWFVDGRIPMLCRMNLLDGNIQIICKLPCQNPGSREMKYSDIYVIDEKVFIIPAWDSNLHIYDFSMNKLCTLYIGEQDKLMFCRAYKKENKIYLMPYAYDYIVSVDCDSFEIKKVCDLRKIKENSNLSYFNDCEFIDNDNILLTSPENNIILMYNLKTNNISVIHTKYNYTMIAKTKNTIWFSCLLKKIIVVYDIHKKRVKKEWWPKNLEILKIMAADNDYMIVNDTRKGYFAIYNENADLINKYQSECVNTECGENDYSGLTRVYGDSTYYINRADAVLLKFSHGKCICNKNLYITDDNLEKFKKFELAQSDNCIINESNFVDLISFLEYVS